MADPDEAGRWTRWGRGLRAGLARRITLDERALAAYRVAVGGLLLLDLLALRAPDLEAFYTDAGVLPRDLHASFFPTAADLSFHTLTGSLVGQGVLLALFCLAALMLLLGYRTRWSAVACWVLLASQMARNPQVVNAGDTLLLATLLFALFLPLGARWSVDALRRGGDQRSSAGAGRAQRALVAVASTGLALQVVTVYATNLLFKLRTEHWLDGTAVQRIFAMDDYTILLGNLLAQAPELLWVGNWVWLATLALSPLLLLLTGWARTLLIGWTAGLHLVMALTLVLGPFPLVSIATLLALVPARAWEGLGTLLDRGTKNPASSPLGGGSGVTFAVVAPASRRHRDRPVLWVPTVLLALLIAGGGLWHASALGYVDRPSGLDQAAGRAGDHQWHMFAPPSRSYGWPTAVVERADGTLADPLRGGPFDPATPAELAEAYPSVLWHRFLKDLPALHADQVEVLADHLCRQTEQAYGSAQHVTIGYVEHRIRLDGPDPVDRQVLLDRPCP